MKPLAWKLRFVACALLLIFSPSKGADSSAPDLVLRNGWALRLGGRPSRTAFHTDPIEAQIVAGQWHGPKAGEVVTLVDGTTREWEPVTAREDGSFTNSAVRGGYFYLPYVADAEKVMLLRASGHSMAYVNGEPRAGDPYQNGSVSLPVLLHAGTNHFLFHCGRGGLQVRLAVPPKPVALDLRDTTAPDIIAGQPGDQWAAVLVVNATTQAVDGLVLRCDLQGGRSRSTRVPRLLPLSTRKVAFQVYHGGRSPTNEIPVQLRLASTRGSSPAVRDQASFSIRFRQPNHSRRETFVSELDGSVQYFAVTPAQPISRNHPPLALVLTAHGAGVEGQGQAEAYSSKSWAHIVAPTNRRNFGFDWEDWGRRDAMEVLSIARARLGTDPQQTYLTGHSMGGHGTWQMSATFPDRFAAIAPSAGWISFFTYAGGRRYDGTNALRQLVQRAATPSDTLVLASNYLHHGIYILHGDADDNVPVSEARTMRGELEKFHRDYAWHEQPGAGHWWGNACVDWPPIFDMFARHKIPSDESVRNISFTTANPGVSASSHWITVAAQLKDLQPSSVNAHWDPNARQFSVATTNVRTLALHLGHVQKGPLLRAVIDGQVFTNLPASVLEQRLWFTRANEEWTATHRPPAEQKGPHRYGPFKEAFLHRMIFVYGTRGTPEENAWAFAKARFDAESFWYRGNGSIDVVPDTAFNPHLDSDRGVILYGNADSNQAWDALLARSPVQVRRGMITTGSKSIAGADLACLFLQPRPGSAVASVGVVSGSGVVGMRLTDRVPYFLAGVAFPDCTVFGPELLTSNSASPRAAGFFGPDWSVERGEFLWQE